jgi:hypothetical protein
MAGRFEQGSNKLIVHNSSSISPFLRGSMGDGGQWWLDVRGDVKPNEDGAWSLGSLTQRWNRVYAVNGTISTSDASLKTAVQDDDLGLEFIRELRPVVWNWKDDDTQADHRGFVAQDVARTLACFKDRRGFAGLVDEGGPMGLAMTEFIGPMVKAVQELDARIAELGCRLTVSDKERGILSAGADTGAFAALRELREKVEAQQTELKRRDAENAELKTRLAHLERIITNPPRMQTGP